MKFDVRIERRDLIVFGAALAALACVSFPEPRPLLVDSVGPTPAPIRPPRAPDVWRERGLVAVRLAAVEPALHLRKDRPL